MRRSASTVVVLTGPAPGEVLAALGRSMNVALIRPAEIRPAEIRPAEAEGLAAAEEALQRAGRATVPYALVPADPLAAVAASWREMWDVSKQEGSAAFEQQAVVMLTTVLATTAVWLAVTFATKPEPDATLDAFYRRVRPGGPGWASVSSRLGFGREPIPGGALAFGNWILGIVLVYTALFGIGKLVFGRVPAGLALLAVAAVSFAVILRNLKAGEAKATPG